LIFVSETDGGGSTAFNSLSLPLLSILSTRFEQPYLGSNYLSMDIRPSPDGGLTPGTRSEIRLKNQGIFQLVSLLEKTRERAVYMRRQMREEEETLRTLNPFTRCCLLIVLSAAYASPQGPSRAGGTPVDSPPDYDG
jgi:WW domain-binding protein 2